MEIEYISAPDFSPKFRVDEGQIYFGRDACDVILGSCISLVIFSDSTLLGGISHITGYSSSGKYNYPKEVITQFRFFEEKYNLNDAVYRLVGGSDKCRQVIDMTIKELSDRHISYSEIDVLGSCHRQLILLPEQNKIKIYRKER